ncbi:MAG TPA: peptidoglycan DD-metalloendopeptidase family protein [Luteibaculaceae bacterium]|nr:peptidoglycan DD-metalloendopeptidase family protein [Luteibaculaceae bacterium]
MSFLDIVSKLNPKPILGFNLTAENTQLLDLSAQNQLMQAVDLRDTDQFQALIDELMAGKTVGRGGYMENRLVYSQSHVFKGESRSRSLHLGVDLWTAALTPVYAPIGGKVHSFEFNDRFGDYGATLILEHQVDQQVFHTLYGHLSLASIEGQQVGREIQAGERVAWIGEPHENGHWPPHLHFQIIIDMQGKRGDYPGVAYPDEQSFYQQNCPDGSLLIV